jgi:hypothetical protein
VDALSRITQADRGAFCSPAHRSGDIERRRAGVIAGDGPIEQDAVLLLNPVHVPGDVIHAHAVDVLGGLVITRKRLGHGKQVSLNRFAKDRSLFVTG